MQSLPFTIKHVARSGDVSLYPATSVNAKAIPGTTTAGVAGLPDVVEFDMGYGDGVTGSIDSGVVYVLNQQGRTVDTYHLKS